MDKFDIWICGAKFKKFKEAKWWPRMDSNHRPLPCQGSALPTELRDLIKNENLSKIILKLA